MGRGKAIAGLSPLGHSGVPATLPSLPPPPALGHHSLGTYSCSAGPPASIAQLGIKWPQGQPWVARKLREHPRAS